MSEEKKTAVECVNDIFKKIRKIPTIVVSLWFLFWGIVIYILISPGKENNSQTVLYQIFAFSFIWLIGTIVILTTRKKILTGYLQTKRIVKEISEAKEAFSKFFNNAPFPIIIFNKDKKILFSNALFGSTVGYEIDAVKEKRLDDFFLEAFDLTRESSNFFSQKGKETWLYTRNNESRYVLAKAKKIKINDEEAFQLILIDITEEFSARKKISEINKIASVAEKIARFGGYKYNLTKNEVTLTGDAINLLGLKEKEKYSFEEILDAIKESDRASLKIRIKNLTEENNFFVVDYELKKPNEKGRVFIRQTGELSVNEKGEKIIWNAILDISEIKRQREVLLEKESRFHLLLDNAIVGLSLFDATEAFEKLESMFSDEIKMESALSLSALEIEGIVSKIKLIEYNKDIIEFFGGNTAGISPQEMLRSVYKDDVEKIAELFYELLVTESMVEKVVRLRRPADEKFQHVLIRAIKYSTKGKTYLILSTADVSDFVKAKQQAQQTNELLYNFLNTIPFPVVSWDKHSKVIFVNKTASNLIGKPRKEILNKNWFDDILENADKQYKIFTDAISKDKKNLQNFTCKLKTKSGSKLIYWYNELMFDEEKQPFGILSLGIDISDENRKRNELNKSHKELILLKNELERRNKSLFNTKRTLQEREKLLQNELAEKDKLFSMIAHDIRSPFSGMLASLQLLKTEYDNLDLQERKIFIENAYVSAKKVFSFIETLLEWSRVKLNKVETNFESVWVMEVVKDVYQLYEAQAKDKEIKLISEVSPRICVQADRNLFNGIIRNLISNAIKFTQRGGEIKILANEFTNKLYEIKIIDSGIGIPAEKLEKIFKVNTVFTTPGTENETGSGLGLMLVNEFIKKLGARIYVDSEQGKGTTFIIHIAKARCEN